MTTPANEAPHALVTHGRQLRAAWDALKERSPGEAATLRRCATANDLHLEGAYWRLVSVLPDNLRAKAAVTVLCFPACAARTDQGFRLGSFLRDALIGDKRGGEKNPLRFRQLLACRTPEELAHRLPRLLKHLNLAVDWGVVFRDLTAWAGSEDARERVSRRWARDFYTADANEPDADDATT